MISIGDANAGVLTGKDLEEMSDDELFDKVRTISIYTRVVPNHKLRIATQHIRHGEIVAMTGDGVNDHLRLRRRTSVSPWGGRERMSLRRRRTW